MIKKRLVKGEGHKKVLEAANNWKTKVEIQRETGLNYTTIDEAIKILLKQGKMEESKTFDIARKKIVKFRNKTSNNSVDPEYLKLLIEDYKSDMKEKNELAFSEMHHIIFSYNFKKDEHLRIFDKYFINFIIEEYLLSIRKYNVEKEVKHAIDILIETEIGSMFNGLIDNLRRDIEINSKYAERSTELLEYIRSKTEKPLIKMVLNQSGNVLYKILVLKKLKTMKHPEIYRLVFEFLKIVKFPDMSYNKVLSRDEILKMHEERPNVKFRTLESFVLEQFFGIEYIIKSYFEINPVDCKRRLWDAYEKQKDKEIKKFILYLIEVTSLDNENIFEKVVYEKYFGENVYEQYLETSDKVK